MVKLTSYFYPAFHHNPHTTCIAYMHAPHGKEAEVTYWPAKRKASYDFQ